MPAKGRLWHSDDDDDDNQKEQEGSRICLLVSHTTVWNFHSFSFTNYKVFSWISLFIWRCWKWIWQDDKKGDNFGKLFYSFIHGHFFSFEDVKYKYEKWLQTNNYWANLSHHKNLLGRKNPATTSSNLLLGFGQKRDWERYSSLLQSIFLWPPTYFELNIHIFRSLQVALFNLFTA